MPWTKPYVPARNQRLPAEMYTYANQVYFITIRAYRDQCPFVREGLNAGLFQLLRTEQERLGCLVFTYCLMPDHLHFLISPARDGISVLAFVDQYKGKTTNYSWSMGWCGRLWQPRYYDHLVRSDESLAAIAEYIVHNPVRKGLVERAEDWLWAGQMKAFLW